jgi:hypothetical protein
MKAASGDWSGGQGSTPALIKLDTTDHAKRAPAIQIRDITLWCRNRGGYGETIGSGSPISGIWLEATYANTSGDGEMNAIDGYGIPGLMADGDNHAFMQNVLVRDSVSAFYWSDTSSGRGVQVANCAALGFSAHGFYINASDAKLSHCTAATGGSGSYGFRISGGNSMMNFSKAFYVRGTGSWGFDVGSSRITITGCESQDNENGFRVSGDWAKLTGCRSDTQVASVSAFDFNGCNHFSADLIIHQRTDGGSYTRGLCLPDTSTIGDGLVDCVIDPTNMTTPVTKGTGYTAVTSGSNLPSGIKCRIAVGGIGYYAN